MLKHTLKYLFPILIACLLLENISIAQSTNCFANPSLEGTPIAHNVPAPWVGCYGTPDTQPGQWGITKAASHGNTYVSFIRSGWIPNNWNEGMTQLLNPPLDSGTQYKFTVDLAHSNIYNTGLPGPCYSSLGVWGGMSACDTSQLLWTSGAFYDTCWAEYTVIFTPTSNWLYVSF